MDLPRRYHRFGWDGNAGPIADTPPLAAVVFLPPPADDVIALKFADWQTALTFADWWGEVGCLNFADYLARWRVPVAPKE